MDKKLIGGGFLVALVLTLAFVAFADMVKPQFTQSQVLGKGTEKQACVTIQEGTLKTSDGREVKPGFDEWGYNYQARIFNGTYCDAYRDAAWCQDYKEDELIMKWNDAWLSNKDCDGDGLLDRHYGFSSYIGSSAWLTNHQSGYYDQDGKQCHWTYFVKIVAAPADAKKEGNIWNTADGKEIGEVIWGEFAIIESIYNDPCAGAHGVEYLSPAGPGFGKY